MRLQAESTLNASFGQAREVFGGLIDQLELLERSDIGCLLLTTATNPVDVTDAAARVAGVRLPASAGLVGSAAKRLAVWLSSRSWLLHCDLEEEEALASRINAAFPDKSLHAALFTDYLCWLELRGIGAQNLLQESSFLSLESTGFSVGHAKRTRVAGIAAVIIRRTDLGWLIGVERSRAAYFATSLRVGRDALSARGLCQ
jgi:heterotetrameric sarcosine oxidase gamma subunit